MFLAKKLNKGAGSPAALDAQFNYVTMLLHGDGTNGAQNNTFLDSSTNNFTITRNGNTTQGSFSPYGSNWSNYFDGSAAYITTSASAISYASDFTVECWFNTTTTTTYASIYSDESAVGGGTILLNNGTNNGQITVYIATAVLNFASTSTGLNNGKWNHVALSRSGSTLRLFINGVLENTTTASGTLATSGTFRIANSYFSGRLFQGYISNFRVTNTAVYTSSFTPSTTPLTAISGTSLLTCQSNRFIDNSTNNFAITVAGGAPSVQRFNPFGTSTAYSTSVIGGSGYFDGSGDYLSVANNTAFDILSGGNFTVECFVYFTSLTDNGGYGSAVITKGSSSGGWILRVTPTDLGLVYPGVSANYISKTFTSGQWYHIVAQRESTTMYYYVNGERFTPSYTDKTTDLSTALTIGNCQADTNTANVTGYIGAARIVKGTAVYSGTTITVPTAPLTAVSGTSILTNYTNGAIFDNAMMNDLETVGNAQISTSVVKYGTGSLKFDGTGDYLIPPSGQNVTFGTGNFTIEGWFYWSSLASESAIMWGNGVGWTFYIYPANKLQWGTTTPQTSANLLTGSTTLATGQWYHIAVTRSSNTLTLWVNGVSDGTVTDSNNYSASGRLALGISHSNEYFNGYMDDVRITKGVARYTTTFTPPTAAFPNTGPV